MSTESRDREETATGGTTGETSGISQTLQGSSDGVVCVPLVPVRPPLCPELELLLLSPAVDLDGDATVLGIATPYWAFCWASGQVLARFVLDHPERIRGRSVLDFGAGCGVVALAAALAGASRVIACDVDPLARAACARNARHMGVTIEVADTPPQISGVDLVLASDVIYEPSARVFLASAPESEGLRRAGEFGSPIPRHACEVWIADPEREGGAARAAALDRAECLARGVARTVPDIDEPTRGAGVFRLRRARRAAAAPSP